MLNKKHESEKQWFVIKAKPHKELLAKTNFEQQGFQVYLPLIEKIRRHARKTETIVKPFFPGYLFIHLSVAEQRWETISSTRGAVGPVRFGDSIPAVPDKVIDSFRSLEDEKNLLQPKKILEQKLVPGSKVSIILSGQNEIEGVFHCYHGKDRAVILLDFLDRQIKTVASCANIVI